MTTKKQTNNNDELLDKKDVIDDLIEDIDLSRSYVLELLFASIIVIFGLLIDSTAIVIGAMLISPIFLPVLGIAMGIISNKENVLRKSLVMLGLSMVGVFTLAFVLTNITPIDTTTQEILARANPTILDLFIALASACIGILAFFDNKIASSSAGVAISISLLPPLATSGIAAAFGEGNIMTRSMLLFLANVGAIVFAGIITLYVLNIRPRRYKKDQQRWKYGVLVSTLFILIISVPLTYFFTNSIQESRINREVRSILNKDVTDFHPDAEFENINITFEQPEDQDKTVVVKATLLLPEQVFLTRDSQTKLSEEISESVNLPVQLKFNVLNTLLIREDQEEDNGNDFAQEVEKEVTRQILALNQGINIDTIDISNGEGDDLTVDLLLTTSQGTLPTIKEKEDIEQILKSLFDKSEVTLNMSFIPVTTIEGQSIETLIRGDIRNLLNKYLPFISSDVSVQNINVNQSSVSDNEDGELSYTADILLLAPEGFEITDDNFELLRANLERDIENSIDYKFKVVSFQ